MATSWSQEDDLMCGGVYYIHDGEPHRVYFPNPAALLPVAVRGDNEPVLLPWGRRKKQPGILPQGGWARLESIYKGGWDRYFPRPVKIPVLSFMEKDNEGDSHWFDVTKGQWVQGLLAQIGDEYRVYVVTITPEHEEAVHDRWPRVLAG